jgi:large subunit ribosomal protein L1
MATKKTEEVKEEKVVKAPAKEVVEAVKEEKKETTAKAGKRSAKAIKEVEEKQAKEERKSTKKVSTEEQPTTKVKQNPPRTRLSRRSKAYKASYKLIEKGKSYPINEAIDLLKKTSKVKFDATVEIHINLNVDPKQADQNVRDSIVLPAGSGKTIKVAVFTEDPEVAKTAGADIAGSDDLLTQIDKGKLNFDILITSPALMPRLAKYARVLGPRGLMPNPRNGSVSSDIPKTIKESKGGRVEYRVDSSGIVHLGVGKVSFTDDQLKDNVTTLMSSIKSNKPSSVKSAFIESVVLTTSMGPSVILDVSSLNQD